MVTIWVIFLNVYALFQINLFFSFKSRLEIKCPQRKPVVWRVREKVDWKGAGQNCTAQAQGVSHQGLRATVRPIRGHISSWPRLSYTEVPAPQWSSVLCTPWMRGGGGEGTELVSYDTLLQTHKHQDTESLWLDLQGLSSTMRFVSLSTGKLEGQGRTVSYWPLRIIVIHVISHILLHLLI